MKYYKRIFNKDGASHVESNMTLEQKIPFHRRDKEFQKRKAAFLPTWFQLEDEGKNPQEELDKLIAEYWQVNGKTWTMKEGTQ